MNELRQFSVINFQNNLLQWYEKEKRELPWRQTNDPYKIWVSEIMLQQTQVATVIPYYEQFLKKFPTVFDLAEADEQTVLKMWEGLGYYSRARNLHHAAKEVVATYDGVVPSDPKQISSLKGIGPYTSGAVLSIAFNKPEPAVDGNVMRVLSRVLLISDNIVDARTRKKFEALVRELISKDDPSSFNQGLMELGALICTPKSPLCLHCPVRDNCRAFKVGMQTELPVRTRAKKQRIEPYIVVLIKDEYGRVLIEQRPNEGLLANMWQFPMANVNEIGINQIEQWAYEKYNINVRLGKELGEVRHVFSHKIWELTIYEMFVTDDNVIEAGSGIQKINEDQKQYANKTLTKISDEQKNTVVEEVKNIEKQLVSSYDKERNVRFEIFDQLSSYPISVSHLKVKQFLEGTLLN